MHEATAMNKLGSIEGAVTVAVIGFVILLGYVLIRLCKVDMISIAHSLWLKIAKVLNKAVFVQERKYHRDVEIGRVSEKSKRVVVYKFFNDLIIDLGLKRRGATPYEFMWFTIIIGALTSYVVGKAVLDSMLMAVLLMPIMYIAVLCVFYTKGNREHDERIDAVIEAENVICNNIKDGVVVAVRNSIDLMPAKVRPEFRDFLDNIEHKNMHIRTALLELNNNLGSISTEFIKKCIVFELEEEAGIVGMFKDIVEVNNIKTEMRNEMKRKFEQVNTEFAMGAFLIFVFLGGVNIVYEDIRSFYLTTTPGRILIAIDCLLMIVMYVIITWLKAREL